MVMKDKLYKNNHKGSYYRARKYGTIGLISFLTLSFISIPIIINFTTEAKAKAEENDNSSSTVNEEEKNKQYLSYEDEENTTIEEEE